MAPLHLVKAKPNHTSSLISDIRKHDRVEWEVGSGLSDPEEELRHAIIWGDSWSVLDNEARCLAIWGVSHTAEPLVGNAWMLATNAATRQLHAMHRMFKDGIGRMHSTYPTLTAWSYSKNILHHKWMLRMGFEDTGREMILGGRKTATFKLFTRRA